MPNDERILETIPNGIVGLVPTKSCTEMGAMVDKYLTTWREHREHEHQHDAAFKDYHKESYIIPISTPRFGSGEAKCVLNKSIRGLDLYILVDVTNWSQTYKLCGHENRMSPDDHYADLKRIIAACSGKARRITVIMPFLYESRQHKRSSRESLDCAVALQELVAMGVDNIITFDAHDPRVQNAIPLRGGFESVRPVYQFIKGIFHNVKDLQIDPEHLMVISPDEGATGRAIYLANILGVDMGMFYKRRDYSVIVNGKNPIVAHEFLGSDIKGKTLIVVDDMISSGGSMLDVAKQMKDRGAARVIVCTTFGLFTDGFSAFDEYYEKGYIDRVLTTNLTYLPQEALEKPYFIVADMSKILAVIIESLNHDIGFSNVLNPTDKIHKLLEKHNKR